MVHGQTYNRDVAQIDIPTLRDVRTYGNRLLIAFNKGEMRPFIVMIYNSDIYTGTYYRWITIYVTHV